MESLNNQGRISRYMNLDELNSYKTAYSKPLDRNDIIKYVILPGLVLSGFSYILLYSWIVSTVLFIAGALYGIKTYLPKSIEEAYHAQSYQERNRFINNLTQVMTDKNKTALQALEMVIPRAKGELHQQLIKLNAQIRTGSKESIAEGFIELADSHKEDVIFQQYIEQVETAVYEGHSPIGTLQDIKDYHNETVQKLKEFQRGKDSQLSDIKRMMLIVVVIILALNFSFGYSTYLNAFARTPVGWVTTGIFLTSMSVIFMSFFKAYFDHSITEVKL